MRTPRRVLLALLVVFAVGAAACATEATRDPLGEARTTTTTTSEDSTTSTPDGSFTPEPIDWSSCAFGQCAKVQVPLDYREPNGRLIEIAVSRTRAKGDRIGALFVNPGGPGATGTDFAAIVAGLLPTTLRDRFDIVGFDPRGVGDSNPVDCGVDTTTLYSVDPTIETPADRTALLDVTKRYIDDCAIKFGDVLPYLSTRDVAKDMDVIRAAMGDAKLSFLGFSYGTAIGQVYADLFPSHVRSMILDGVLDLGPTGLQLADEQAAGFETALQRYTAYCDSGTECATSGDALGAVERVLELAEKPGGIPAPSADRPAGRGEATLAVAVALYSRSMWERLDAALDAALGGDGSKLVALADQYIGIGDFEIYFAVNCMDFAWPTGDPDAILRAAKETAKQSPHLGEALVTDYVRCADWPVPADPLQPITAPGSPPILVVSTTGDPATPYAAGVAVAQRLERGVLVTNEGDGHTVVADGKPCIDEIVVRYLIDGATPPDGTTCA
ncbi:MAG: alpha/beta hydrolase [Microthrixaceae bacterium]